MTMNLSIVADLVVASLLVVTIFYAARLNRRLRVLRGDKAELQVLVQNLAVASQHAEAGIAALKAAAEDIGRRLEKKVEQAQSLREDLTYMVDRGGDVADRLEGSIRARRDEPRVEPMRQRAAEPLRAAERSPAPERPRAVDPAPVQARPRREPGPLALDFPLPAAANRSLAEEPTSPGTPSRAERNLLRALTGRR
jgi:hypothetical protein